MVDISFLLKLRNLGFATSEDMEIIDTAAMAGEPEELGPEDVFMKTGVYSGSEEMVVEEMDRYIDLRIHVYNDRKLWKCFDNTCTDFSNSNDVFALRLCNNRSRLLTIAKDAHQSSDFRLRADATNAINALGKMGAKEYAGDIAAIAKDNNVDSDFRAHAIEALVKMAAKEYIAAIAKDNNVDSGFRASAIEALGEMDAKGCAGDIAAIAKDNNVDPDFLRAYAIEALVKMDAKEYAGDIAAIAKDNNVNSDLRASAIEALVKMDAKEYAGDIAAIIKDNNINGGLRENAIDALGKMGARTELTRLFDDAEIPERLREEIHNKISLALDE